MNGHVEGCRTILSEQMDGEGVHRCTVIRFDPSKGEALLLLWDAPCTIRMVDLICGDDAFKKLISRASPYNPVEAEATLGAWCHSTHAFHGGSICKPQRAKEAGGGYMVGLMDVAAGPIDV